ncbi:hypothetical protein SLS62_006468 [Diatrype stigma]|uniref:EXPERA domain-containing protein n=1 Tax=Diatrype stigma TaxID=117547 RepID=A0AAN9UQS7_9PEZI
MGNLISQLAPDAVPGDGVEVVEEQGPPPGPQHPYYPEGVAIPGYEPNELPVHVLSAAMAGMLGFALLGSSAAARWANPHLSKTDLAVFCWFVLSSSQSLFAQLWKEYALSDSRYLTSDYFMLSVESITVLFWGPLCFLCALTTALPGGRPLRHPLRILACMAHLYGVALYYATSLCELYFTGRSHSRPEPIYFWGYYVGFNLPWVIVPAVILGSSLAAVTRAFRALDGVNNTLDGFWKSNGKPTVESKESRKTK